MRDIHGTFSNDHVSIHQYKYPYHLYRSEVRTHETCIHEYATEILATMTAALEAAAPNVKLYNNQPYVSPVVRFKLVDFLLKMLVRLKILPFVFYRAVRIFDRYCLKRIVLLDQAQLIITTCLWIAAKINGGNNHFANMSSDRKNNTVNTISDLGYGGGARFRGPTERYRLPKLNELIKLCGSRCNYDAEMFKQMEMHIMTALDWRLNDPSIEEYMVYSHEYKVTEDEPLEAKLGEFFKMKEFVSYASCYAYELVGYSPLQVSKVVVDLINETFSLRELDLRFQTLNQSILVDEAVVDFKAYRDIQKHLVQAIVKAPPYLLQMFASRGPQLLHLLLASNYRPANVSSYTASMVLEPSSASSSVFSEYHATSNYSYASPAPSIHNTEYTGEFAPKSVLDPKFPEGFAPITRRPPRMAPTPDFDALHSNSHHYPPMCPPACSTYLRNNDSQVSLRSASSKDQEIFDYDPARYGISTPMSVDEEFKHVPEGKAKRRAF
ncbi:CIC11C00000005172 [Sungouiella intermedia]|uniref:CIC11C00000005172 n=1 Tax=Sungouiella intermedia TaxID=45354 RepID=A0A1L0BAA9_9ASCO|nr:CIC11C00000005172 [[Candida] intermedia]